MSFRHFKAPAWHFFDIPYVPHPRLTEVRLRERNPTAATASGPGLCAEVRARGEMMRMTLNVVAGLLVLSGATWFLQGINVLPGSFMTGQIRWAVYGGIAVAAGIALFLIANLPRKGR
jgi:hypothetical protein